VAWPLQLLCQHRPGGIIEYNKKFRYRRLQGPEAIPEEEAGILIIIIIILIYTYLGTRL
jgi:hypothetical protein